MGSLLFPQVLTDWYNSDFPLSFHSPLLVMESKGSVRCVGLLFEHSATLRAGSSHCH